MAVIKEQRIRFYYQKKIALRDAGRVKATVCRIFKDAGLNPESINYVFSSDEDVLAINLQYLRHNTYTDIITFDLSETPGKVIADIYISVDRVRENARLHNVSIKSELLRVIFHGALHLTGQGDKSKKDKALMRRREEEYLQVFAKSFHGTRFR
jgi:probable rRNA maturation factor